MKVQNRVLVATITVLLSGCLTDTDPGPSVQPDAGVDTTSEPDAVDDVTTQEDMPTTCVPTDEVCDGDDNDCDGEVDEGFTQLGKECSIGIGACVSAGTNVCKADGSGTECGAPIIEPGAEEICNNIDDTCDGDIDEGCDDDGDDVCDSDMMFDTASDACPNGEGDCDDDDDTVFPGAPGLCDEKDNDCNGEVDEVVHSGVETLIDLADVVLTTTAPFPILAGYSGNQLCAAAQTGTNRTTLIYGVNAGRIYIGPNGTLMDFVAGPDYCYAAVESGGSLRIVRWDIIGKVEALITNNRLASLQNSAIALRSTDIVVGIHVDDGSASYEYRTMPLNFMPTEDGTVQHSRSIFLGESVELLPLTTGFDFLNIYNIVGDTQFLADETGQAGLKIDDTRDEVAAATVDGKQYLAVAADGTFEVREILQNLTYGPIAQLPGTVGNGQEFHGRELFSGGPLGLQFVVDPFNDKLYSFENANNAITATEVVLPSTDNVLSVYFTGDRIRLLQLANAGLAGSADAQLRYSEITCN